MASPGANRKKWRNQIMEPTLNDTGFMFKILDDYAREFIGFAGETAGPVLEVGCAFGNVTIPALEADATFSIRFSDGEQAQASAALDGLQGHRHVALQWRGQTGLGIATQAVGEAETGAVVSALGDTGIADGWRAEVLTVATEKAAAARVFRVAVAAPVTPETCGRDIAATTLEAAPDGHYRSTPVTLSAAGCDSVGDIRLLKNLLSDLRVAPNEP